MTTITRAEPSALTQVASTLQFCKEQLLLCCETMSQQRGKIGTMKTSQLESEIREARQAVGFVLKYMSDYGIHPAPVTDPTDPPPCYDGGACRNADTLTELQARLTTLRELWAAMPAGTREFIGNYGTERARLLAEFESALGLDPPTVTDTPCACPVPGFWPSRPDTCPTCNRAHRERGRKGKG